jgi:DNA-binding transcriptional LysR family regulator
VALNLFSTKRLATQLDLRTLQVFLTVAEMGSFTEAAVREHLVVSAISRRIANLERLVGAKLVERRRDGVALTSAGRELADRARQMWLVLAQMQEGIDAHQSGLRGEVQLYSSTSALLDKLPARVASFMNSHPEVDVQLRECDSTHVVRCIRDGRAHLGVYSSYVDAAGLQAFPYFQNRLVVVASTKHPIAKKAAVRFEDTLKYDYVGVQDGDTFNALIVHIQKISRGFSTRMRIRIKAASMGASCRMVEAGIGIAILPATTARFFAEALDIATIELRDAWASIRTDIGCRDQDELPPAARKLFEHLRTR